MSETVTNCNALKPVRCGCGGEATIVNPHAELYMVRCAECMTATTLRHSEAEAIQAWNRAMGWVSAEDKTVDKGLLHLLHAIMQPHEIVVMNVNLKGLTRALEALPERHKEILTMYYCEGKTLEEIGKAFGVTRERVRQLREFALREMRHPLMRKWYCEASHE